MLLAIGLQTAFLSSIILFIIFGNGLVIASVASCRRLRTITNVFTVSLAVADLALSFLVLPLSVAYLALSPEVGWPFGWVTCRFWLSCDVMCCTASIVHLCLISLDRYIAITDPLRYHLKMSGSRALVGVCCAWCISVSISFLPIFLDWFSDTRAEPSRSADHEAGVTISWFLVSNSIRYFQSADLPMTSAPLSMETGSRRVHVTFDLGSDSNFTRTSPFAPAPEVPSCTLQPNKTYAVITSCTAFYLPLTVMIISYANIYRIAERQRIGMGHQGNRSRFYDSPIDGDQAQAQRVPDGVAPSFLPTFLRKFWRMRRVRVHCDNAEVASVESVTVTEHLDFVKECVPDNLQNVTVRAEIPVIEVSEPEAVVTKDARMSTTDVTMENGESERRPSDFKSNLQTLKVQDLCRNGDRRQVSFSKFLQSWKHHDKSGPLSIASHSPLPPFPLPPQQDHHHHHHHHHPHRHQRKRRQRNDRKAIRTLGVLMGLFCACWLPFFVMYLVLPFCQLRVCIDSPKWLVDAITWLGYSNSLFNPCVYALTNRDFKEAYWKLVRFRRFSK